MGRKLDARGKMKEQDYLTQNAKNWVSVLLEVASSAVLNVPSRGDALFLKISSSLCFRGPLFLNQQKTKLEGPESSRGRVGGRVETQKATTVWV